MAMLRAVVEPAIPTLVPTRPATARLPEFSSSTPNYARLHAKRTRQRRTEGFDQPAGGGLLRIAVFRTGAAHARAARAVRHRHQLVAGDCNWASDPGSAARPCDGSGPGTETGRAMKSKNADPCLQLPTGRTRDGLVSLAARSRRAEAGDQP